jgi:hypothetical protein
MKNKGVINNAIKLFISKPLKVTNARIIINPTSLNAKHRFIVILGIFINSLLSIAGFSNLKNYLYFTIKTYHLLKKTAPFVQ